MRLVLCSFLLLHVLGGLSQIPLYNYRELDFSLELPTLINSERCIVVVHVQDENNGFRKVGKWDKLAQDAHRAFTTMGLDPILYINHYDLIASNYSRENYSELFTKRNVRNIIFLTRYDSGFELIIVPFNNSKSFINNGEKSYHLKESTLYDLMLKTGKEVRRANQEISNLLVPEKPNVISGMSIVEKTQLKNYPGVLRRSTLAVERFAKLAVPENSSEQLINKITNYNLEIEAKNKELETIIEEYPYDYVIIDPMSYDELLRNRHQFVLRSISGQAMTLRQMLDYSVSSSETDFVSVIPIMPDQTRAMPIPRNALVHKFYIKQNVSKNVHVGEWDADVTWQSALKNMIGNLIQEHNVN